MGTKGSVGLHVDVGTDMASDGARVVRAQAVGQMAVSLPEYTSDLVFKGAIDALVKAGVNLGAAIGQVDGAKVGLANARGVRATKRTAFRKANTAAITQVEKYAHTPADIAACGYTALVEASGAMVDPIAVLATFDPEAEVIDVHVKYPKGVNSRCVIAVSPSPVGPATYVELPAHGRKQGLSGYAPGTYWIRACTIRAKVWGAWFGPVSVIVK
jgi:hypothetical protein